MPGAITITAERGNQSQTLTITERESIVVGSAADCTLRVDEDTDGFVISRTQCLLDIDPPLVTIRDYGSLNGTYLNGNCIGKRPVQMSAEEGRKLTFPCHPVKNGDVIALASGERMARLHVRITSPRACSNCAGSLPVGKGFCDACMEQVRTRWQAIDRAKQEAEAHGELNPYFRQFYDLPKMADYEFVCEIDEGSYGLVHQAIHKPTGDMVAIKFVVPANPTIPAYVARVERETLVWAALHHPNIIAFREGFCIDGIFVMVSEFAAQGNLTELVWKLGPLAPREAVALFLPVLDALDYAHHAHLPKNLLKNNQYVSAKGAIHRDIKPPNLLLDANGCLKIADFGMAKAFELSGLTGLSRSHGLEDHLGTYEFMPRQQALRLQHPHQEFDVWAAAASLFFTLTGECPRDFSFSEDAHTVVLQSNARPIEEVAAKRKINIPPRLARVINETLIDKPAIRVRTIREFKSRLMETL